MIFSSIVFENKVNGILLLMNVISNLEWFYFVQHSFIKATVIAVVLKERLNIPGAKIKTKNIEILLFFEISNYF